MPNNRRSLADILSEPMTELENDWVRLWEESLTYRELPQDSISAMGTGRNPNPWFGGRLVNPSENLRIPQPNGTYTEVPVNTGRRLRRDSYRQPIFTRPQEPFVIDRPTNTLADTIFQYTLGDMYDMPRRSLSGLSETIEPAHLTPPKPDYEVVTDTVLIDLILEHVRPWFESRADVIIKLNKLEKSNLDNGKRFRVSMSYQYKNTVNSSHWYSNTLFILNDGEVQS